MYVVVFIVGSLAAVVDSLAAVVVVIVPLAC